MATRYAVATGLWSSASTWDGTTTIPSPGDDVYANAKTVTIDVDISVNTLRTTSNASPAITAGGGFVISSVTGTRYITCTVAIGTYIATTQVVTVSATSGTVDFGTSAFVGGSSSGMSGLTVSGACAVAGSGQITGGSGSTSYGINVSAGATLTMTGAVSAGGGSVAINSSNTSAILDLGGTLTASTSFSAISAAGLTNRVTTLVDASNGRKAIYAPGWVVKANPANSSSTVRNDATPSVAVVMTNYVSNSPTPGNVRAGVTYGPSGTLTGTMAVPAAGSVAKGVAVDATTGTATLTDATTWAYEVSSGVTAATRLGATATSASTGAQLAAAMGA